MKAVLDEFGEFIDFITEEEEEEYKQKHPKHTIKDEKELNNIKDFFFEEEDY